MTCEVNRRSAPVVVHWLRDRVDRVGSMARGDAMREDCPPGACQSAAIRAYRGLRESGLSDRAAFEASVTLYRLRHRAASQRDAVFQVAEWISDDLEGDTTEEHDLGEPSSP